MIDIGKKKLFTFCIMLENVHLFAFAFKVCKKCYYGQKKIFVKNINMGIINKQNFMLISNLLMPAFRMPLLKVKSKKPGKNAQKRKYSNFA